MRAKHLLTLLFLIVCNINIQAQDNGSLASVKQNYPKLFSIFGNEFSSLRADYYFAVDVSGSMPKYAPTVQPALKAFFGSLQNGDYATLIRFGTIAKVDMGSTGVINNAMKQSLMNGVDNMYKPEPSLIRHTDIARMTDELCKQIRVGSNNLKFVFIITDFLNDVEGKGESKISSQDLAKIKTNLKAAFINKDVRVIALQLPKMGTGSGYCLDQIESAIPEDIKADRYEKVEVTNETGLSSWFVNLKRKIMEDKFRAFIMSKNRAALPKIKSEVTIDGVIKSDIDWQPSQLYSKLIVKGSTLKGAPDFTISNGSDLPMTLTGPTDDAVELGDIDNQSLGFAHCNATATQNFELPTDFDDELTALRVEKPNLSTSIKVDRMLFTFPLSFRTTCIIIILLLLYIIGVIHSAMRNAAARFRFTVVKKDINTLETEHQKKELKAGQSLHITMMDNSGYCDLKFFKANPFLVFTKPYLMFINLHKCVCKKRDLNTYKFKPKGQSDTVYSPDRRNPTGSFYVKER